MCMLIFKHRYSENMAELQTHILLLLTCMHKHECVYR